MATKTNTKKPKTKKPKAPTSQFDKNLKTLYGKNADKAKAGKDLYDATMGGGAKTITNNYSNQLNDLVARTQAFESGAGSISQGTSEALARQNRLADESGKSDPIRAQIMEKLMGQLGGYSADDQQRFREQNIGALDQGLRSGIRGAVGGAAGSGFGGGAAGALAFGAQQNYATKAAEMERGLYLDNIAEQQRRLGMAGDYATGMDQDRWNRMTTTANNAFSSNMGVDQFQQQSKLAALNRLSNTLSGVAGFDTSLQQYNNDSLNNWQLGQFAAMGGGAGYTDARADAQKSFELAQQSINKLGGGGSGGGGGGGGGGGAAAADEWDLGATPGSSTGGSTTGGSSALPSGSGGTTSTTTGRTGGTTRAI